MASEGEINYFVTRKLSDAETKLIHSEIIEKGFFDVNSRTDERQHMTLEEFEGDVNSPTVLKFIARDEDKIRAIMTVHLGLDRVTWINTDFVQEIQQKVDPTSPELYIGTIVVDPAYPNIDKIGTKIMRHAFSEYFKHFKTQDYTPVIFFDCAWVNVPLIPSLVLSSLNHAEDNKNTMSVFEWRIKEDGGLKIISFNPAISGEDDKRHYNYAVAPLNLNEHS